MTASRLVRLVMFALVVAAAYAVSMQVRVSTDAHLNYIQTRALVLHGDIDLDRYGEQEGFVTRRGGRLYSVYGTGISVVAAPLFALLVRTGARAPALHAAGSIPFAAVAVVAMFLLLERLFDRAIAVGGALVLGFGTTLWPVGTTAFWQQAAVVMFTSLGLLAFFSDDDRAPLWAGLAFGLAVYIRPTTVFLVVLAGGFYLVRSGRLRASAWYLVGLLPAAVAVVISNRWIWGSWIGGYGTAGVGFHGDVARNVPRLLFGWWRGVFPYSPVLVLSVAGLGMACVRWRNAVAARMIVLALSCAATVLFYARWTTWWGGANQFGYRYLLDIAPALVVLVAYAVSGKRWMRIPAVVLGSVSIATMAAGSAPDKYWWDQNPDVFARSLSSSPFGRAWAAVPPSPRGWLGRMAVVAIVIAVAIWASRLAPKPRSSRHDVLPDGVTLPR